VTSCNSIADPYIVTLPVTTLNPGSNASLLAEPYTSNQQVYVHPCTEVTIQTQDNSNEALVAVTKEGFDACDKAASATVPGITFPGSGHTEFQTVFPDSGATEYALYFISPTQSKCKQGESLQVNVVSGVYEGKQSTGPSGLNGGAVELPNGLLCEFVTYDTAGVDCGSGKHSGDMTGGNNACHQYDGGSDVAVICKDPFTGKVVWASTLLSSAGPDTGVSLEFKNGNPSYLYAAGFSAPTEVVPGGSKIAVARPFVARMNYANIADTSSTSIHYWDRIDLDVDEKHSAIGQQTLVSFQLDERPTVNLGFLLVNTWTPSGGATGSVMSQLLALDLVNVDWKLYTMTNGNFQTRFTTIDYAGCGAASGPGCKWYKSFDSTGPNSTRRTCSVFGPPSPLQEYKTTQDTGAQSLLVMNKHVYVLLNTCANNGGTLPGSVSVPVVPEKYGMVLDRFDAETGLGGIYKIVLDLPVLYNNGNSKNFASTDKWTGRGINLVKAKYSNDKYYIVIVGESNIALPNSLLPAPTSAKVNGFFMMMTDDLTYVVSVSEIGSQGTDMITSGISVSGGRVLLVGETNGILQKCEDATPEKSAGDIAAAQCTTAGKEDFFQVGLSFKNNGVTTVTFVTQFGSSEKDYNPPLVDAVVSSSYPVYPDTLHVGKLENVYASGKTLGLLFTPNTSPGGGRALSAAGTTAGWNQQSNGNLPANTIPNAGGPAGTGAPTSAPTFAPAPAPVVVGGLSTAAIVCIAIFVPFGAILLIGGAYHFGVKKTETRFAKMPDNEAGLGGAAAMAPVGLGAGGVGASPSRGGGGGVGGGRVSDFNAAVATPLPEEGFGGGEGDMETIDVSDVL
ncbi:hypothetical protein TeGR_g3045, partial [Tetraparma gracilis]